MPTNSQLKAIHATLNRMGRGKDKEFKEQLVRQYSQGRETSTAGLSMEEARQLINDLQKTIASLPKGNRDEELRARKVRYFYHLAHMMGWEKEDGSVDLAHLNAWCVKYGTFHKPLHDLTTAQMSTVLTQLEAAYKAFLKSV
ncbi:MAG: hypothetical protein EBZ77_04565 [Chitinophagia bacterium]|nr:hypothetical protein [Chitinophagia bacterium]